MTSDRLDAPVGRERCRKRGRARPRAPVAWAEVWSRRALHVFRVEGSLSRRVRADTRQRLGRGEVPQADPLAGVCSARLPELRLIMRRMRILVTGASGVLGRLIVPLLLDSGHHVATPSSSELDLFDADRVREAVAILMRCCTWRPASLLRIAGSFPAPGMPTTGCVPTRPGSSLTARWPAMRRSSWCPRSRSLPAGPGR